MALPSHLKKTNYVNPSNGVKSAFQDGYRTSSHFFEFLKENPAHAEQFNNHMTAYHQGRPSWMDEGFFPVPSLTEGLDISAEDVLLVDVGGGVGHDLTEFRRKWPNIPGRLVLEDLPEVIDQAKAQNQATASLIEPVVHDFFAEQPVKGTQTPSCPLYCRDRELTMQAPEHTTCTPSCTTGPTPTADASCPTWRRP